MLALEFFGLFSGAIGRTPSLKFSLEGMSRKMTQQEEPLLRFIRKAEPFSVLELEKEHLRSLKSQSFKMGVIACLCCSYTVAGKEDS